MEILQKNMKFSGQIFRLTSLDTASIGIGNICVLYAGVGVQILRTETLCDPSWL